MQVLNQSVVMRAVAQEMVRVSGAVQVYMCTV